MVLIECHLKDILIIEKIKRENYEVTYGCGKEFDSSKFNLIENQDFVNKPMGGLWASPVSSKYGWKEWCNAENFKTTTLKTFFDFKIKRGKF